MPRLALFNLLLLFSCVCHGQFIFTPQKPIVRFDGSIDKHEAIQIKDSIPFAAVRIIDSRYDTTNIGFYIDGFLTLKDSSQPMALQHVVNKYFKSLFLSGKDTLVIQLEKLSIQEAMVYDTGFLYTSGVLSFKKYSGGAERYKYLGSVDTMMMEKFAHNNFNEHRNGKHFNMEFWDWYLLRLFESMILSAVRDSMGRGDERYYTVDEIRTEGLQKRDKAILTTGNPKPGFYRTFFEFVNNDPGFGCCQVENLNKLLKVMNYRVDGKISNEEPDTSYWGFSDGRRFFIRDRYSFFQLERRDAGFYVSPTLDALRRSAKRAALNLLIGLGSIAGGIAAKEGPDFRGFSTIPAPELPMVTIRLENCFAVGLQLDWKTGKITY